MLDTILEAAQDFAQSKPLTTLACAGASLYLLSNLVASRPQRTQIIPENAERVLVIGGTSGIGEAIALQYASRGARVCVTGRRSTEVQRVQDACLAARVSTHGPGDTVDAVGIPADFTNAEEMVRVRGSLEESWGGLDTVIVSAGVSALRPLLDIAGISPTHPQATAEEIQHVVDVAQKATQGNYIGPLVSAVTFIPLLKSSSKSPSILLVSSTAAVLPAPTRSLYGSTKSASLILYQALAIEHPSIAFTMFMPFTVEGDFRASAVDGGEVREADPNKGGLKRGDVARRCVSAVDAGEKVVFMPMLLGRVAHLLYWVWPEYVEKRASKKYNFTP